MVVCKFFQQGNCRYGQSCRFDHIYGSKYSYHAQPVSQPVQPGVTDELLINQVETDVKSVLNGGQWILSCYSPFKEKPNFPGIPDLSPEEARLFIYEAKANNNLDQAVSYMNNQFVESRRKYEQLVLPNQAIVKVLRSLYRGETVASPFAGGQSSGFETNSAATSIFRSAVQGTSVFGQNTNSSPSIFSQNSVNQSVFGQTSPNTKPSVFGQNTNTGFGQNSAFDQKPNVFGSPTAESAKSIFAQASQNVFGPSSPSNVFAPSNADPAKSIFAQASQSAFNMNQAQPSTNAASIFSAASQSAFGKSSDPFNSQQQPASFGKPAQNVFQVQTDESSVYSDIDILSPEDIEAFKADDFKLGFIPEMPPPRSLCF
ncbi:nucleoporin AMO1-like isoform X2 [Ostrinia furnacalis]|uniref:nucleoporin AMO1-like isoform X2 n=1 Tax=Ostrinia furnacalis TaxID=93504 RepID=UPI00103AF46B|nr:nucleoporin AMO1-like isoform X2 [Ostrinia furnacalis]